MPEELERKLRRQANKHHEWSEERKDAYVYGTMRKTGWKPSHQRNGDAKRSHHSKEANVEMVFEKEYRAAI